MGLARSTGLVWHILYPSVAIILLSIPTFTSSSSINFVSLSTSPTSISPLSYIGTSNGSWEEVRFGSTDYCGYNVTVQRGEVRKQLLGCVGGGWGYGVPQGEVGVRVPGGIRNSLGQAAIVLPVCFAFLILGLMVLLPTTLYSYRPFPKQDRVYTCVHLNFVISIATFSLLFVGWFVLVCICGAAVNDKDMKRGGTSGRWGQGVWLVLGAAVSAAPWVYEAARWRWVVNKKD